MRAGVHYLDSHTCVNSTPHWNRAHGFVALLRVVEGARIFERRLQIHRSKNHTDFSNTGCAAGRLSLWCFRSTCLLTLGVHEAQMGTPIFRDEINSLQIVVA